MAVCPLRPATDLRLGRPLPHQPANRTQAPLQAPPSQKALALRLHAVLAVVSHGYPPPKDRSLRVTHPSATDAKAEAPTPVRLACVKHAASVRSEPGSNSQVHPQDRHPHTENADPPINPPPNSSRRPPQCSSPQKQVPTPEWRLAYRNASVIQQNTSAPQSSAPNKPDDTTPSPQNTKPAKTQTPDHAPLGTYPKPRPKTPPTYPFLPRSNCQRTNRSRAFASGSKRRGAAFTDPERACQRRF